MAFALQKETNTQEFCLQGCSQALFPGANLYLDTLAKARLEKPLGQVGSL